MRAPFTRQQEARLREIAQAEIAADKLAAAPAFDVEAAAEPASGWMFDYVAASGTLRRHSGSSLRA